MNKFIVINSFSFYKNIVTQLNLELREKLWWEIREPLFTQLARLNVWVIQESLKKNLILYFDGAEDYTYVN